nr:uncharacterized protein LOC124813759 [Hydra vulgaris]
MTVKNINQIETEFIYKNKLNHDLRANLVKLHVGTIEWLDTDSKVTFYTGLPNLKTLCCLFNFLKPLITENENSVLLYFEEFSLTLMKLRLNLSIRDLAYRFETSKSTSSKVFLRWIDIMYFRMKHLIKWPARNELIETMPLCFRKYFETKVVGLLRNKYKVLQSIMPLDYLYTKDSGLCTIDKIVIVCSSLINICDSIIPVE